MQRIGPRIQFNVELETRARLDAIAAYHEITRSEAARRMMAIGMDVHDEYRSIGVPQLAKMVSKTREILREWRQPKLVK